MQKTKKKQNKENKIQNQKKMNFNEWKYDKYFHMSFVE